MGTGRLVVGKRGDGERVAGAWVRADFRMVILGGDVGEGRKGGTSKSGRCWLHPAYQLSFRLAHRGMAVLRELCWVLFITRKTVFPLGLLETVP